VFFLVVSLIIWLLYTIVMKMHLKEKFRLFNALLPLVLFSLIVSISLGVNYTAAAIPSINDGIGIHSFLAYWVIGEDGWSVDLFKSYFDYSLIISIVLLIVYSGLRIFDNK